MNKVTKFMMAAYKLQKKKPNAWYEDDYYSSILVDGSLKISHLDNDEHTGETIGEDSIVIPYKYLASFYEWIYDLMEDK